MKNSAQFIKDVNETPVMRDAFKKLVEEFAKANGYQLQPETLKNLKLSAAFPNPPGVTTKMVGEEDNHRRDQQFTSAAIGEEDGRGRDDISNMTDAIPEEDEKRRDEDLPSVTCAVGEEDKKKGNDNTFEVTSMALGEEDKKPAPKDDDEGFGGVTTCAMGEEDSKGRMKTDQPVTHRKPKGPKGPK
jgi:hypothetical protein